MQYADKKDNMLYGFCRLRLPHNNFVIPASEPGSRMAAARTHGEFSGFRALPAGRRVSARGGSAFGGKPGMTDIKNCALIRELHVYGELVPIGNRKKVQHAGLGKKLMAEVEKIARANGFKKIDVISGVGARGYYRKLGYKLEDTYMVKSL